MIFLRRTLRLGAVSIEIVLVDLDRVSVPGLAIIRGEAATGARKGQGVTKALVGRAQNNCHVVPCWSEKVISKVP